MSTEVQERLRQTMSDPRNRDELRELLATLPTTTSTDQRSAVGVWKVGRAIYFAGELATASDADWSADWRSIDLDNIGDPHPSAIIKWSVPEELQYYLAIYPDGTYQDADFTDQPPTFVDQLVANMPDGFYSDEEFHERAESNREFGNFPVGTMTKWLKAGSPVE